ncbi:MULTISPECIES: Dabb family protein [Derxia]|uniref:Dabb family protein n=1 Tax=Derxia gummosa DSM 723 TaxID=1121388 RepID=A0A8B6X797_9BURK|nr:MULTISPECIES: Dabb family protein [Derxia]
MIRHIVFFSARDKGDLPTILDGLRLLEQIPDARFFEVQPCARIDQIGNEVEVVVYGEFDDEAALARFKAHPLYEESIRVVRPLRELRVAADFVSRLS